MSSLELMIWSMAAGAIGAVVLAGLTDLAFSRSQGAAQGAMYHCASLLFVIILSGMPELSSPPSVSPAFISCRC
jgi:hypothetical protein